MTKSAADKTIQTGRTLPTRFSSYKPPRQSGLPPRPPQDAKPRLVARTLLIFMILLLAVIAVLGVWDARNLSAASRQMFGSGNILDLLGSGPLISEGGRVNILLVGYSADDPGHPAANLTDSIILLSMSTTSPTGYMLSIPRDLYVMIPGYGYGKINEAYSDGGMQLLKQVISKDFQSSVNYYSLINYASVRDIVNALGGIKLTINSPDARGLYDPNISPHDGGPLNLSNGVHVLDGQTALNLTRARGDPCDCGQAAYGFSQSDFDRTQHQRQVLTAIKSKLSWSLVLNPLKNQKILKAAAGNIKTDIKSTEIRAIFDRFNSIPAAQLQSISLRDLNGHNYLSSYYAPDGGDALIPSDGLDDYASINAALAELNR